jgi:glutamine synthetase
MTKTLLSNAPVAGTNLEQIKETINEKSVELLHLQFVDI